MNKEWTCEIALPAWRSFLHARTTDRVDVVLLLDEDHPDASPSEAQLATIAHVVSGAFPPEQIHNTNNLIPVERSMHKDISAWYGRGNKDGELSPRESLRGQSWEAQHSFGLKVLKDFGVIP